MEGGAQGNEAINCLVFFNNWIKLDEFTLIVLTVVDEFCELFAYGLDIVETRKGHVAIQVGGGGSWVNGEHLNGCVALLELDGHHTHHCILGSLAGYILIFS